MCKLCDLESRNKSKKKSKKTKLSIKNCFKIEIFPNISHFSNLLELACIECEYLSFSTKICLPDSLEKFICQKCPKVTCLPPLPKNLVILNCQMCPIKQFPTLPDKLEEFYCTYCPVEILPDMPETLDILDCDNSSVVAFSKLPKRIYHLTMCETRISKMPNVQGYKDYENCHWIPKPSSFWTYEKRVFKLCIIQKSMRKYLYRRRLLLFSVLKRRFAKDICSFIFTFLFLT